MAVFGSPTPHRLAVLVRPGLLPMELGIVHQLFGGATAGSRRLYQVVSCAVSPGEIVTSAGFSINVTAGPAALSEADTVIVPAAKADKHDDIATLDDSLLDALGRIRSDARIASICTGAFVLAAAGLLDGTPATTHWKSAERFRRLFPAVHLDPEVLYTDAGRLLTSAGEASGLDLCLHIIRRDHGAGVANALARDIVVPPHRDGGQAQFIQYPVPQSSAAATARARDWALGQLHRPISLHDMARRESMSTRHFTRRFRQENGISPGQWLKQQRIARAQQLLEDTDLSVDRVAIEAGFGTGTALRQHLRDALGISPRAYRRTFRGSAS